MTSNINISKDNIQGKCDLKCFYSFKYNDSNITAKNNGVMISLAYDISNTPPAVYNNDKYNVSNIYITCPSIHIFDGINAVGEIIIEHISTTGGSQLNVAIPFTSSTESNSASSLITQIIDTVASNAPANGESTNLNISGFSLQNIIPKKPFYSYTDSANNNWIVFDIMNAIPLSSSTLSTLGTIIQPFSITTDGNILFYNSTGPNSSLINSEGIYISCQPTGSSGETGVMVEKNPVYSSFSSLFSSSGGSLLLQILFGIVAFIIIFVGLNYAYSYLTSDTPKSEFFPNFRQKYNLFHKINK
jgi:hypothetical protein